MDKDIQEEVNRLVSKLDETDRTLSDLNDSFNNLKYSLSEVSSKLENLKYEVRNIGK
jgi:peptidoglycan hydrolase CwlO-like protein